MKNRLVAPELRRNEGGDRREVVMAAKVHHEGPF